MKKLNKVVLSFIVLLVVTGCGRVEIDGDHVRQAIELCGDNGGLKNINQIKWIQPNYQCNNGVGFKIYGGSISKRTPNNTTKGE